MIGNVKLTIKNKDELLGKRGMGSNKRVQMIIDSEVLRRSDPLVPLKTGQLKQSGTRSTKLSSGIVRYNTPYARKMYYNPQYNFNEAPQRGGKWFERMKASHKKEILEVARKEAGAK